MTRAEEALFIGGALGSRDKGVPAPDLRLKNQDGETVTMSSLRGRPVVVTHHVDVHRYAVPCDPAAPYDSKEWDPCDVHAFHTAGFRVMGFDIDPRKIEALRVQSAP